MGLGKLRHYDRKNPRNYQKWERSHSHGWTFDTAMRARRRAQRKREESVE